MASQNPLNLRNPLNLEEYLKYIRVNYMGRGEGNRIEQETELKKTDALKHTYNKEIEIVKKQNEAIQSKLIQDSIKQLDNIKLMIKNEIKRIENANEFYILNNNQFVVELNMIKKSIEKISELKYIQKKYQIFIDLIHDIINLLNNLFNNTIPDFISDQYNTIYDLIIDMIKIMEKGKQFTIIDLNILHKALLIKDGDHLKSKNFRYYLETPSSTHKLIQYVNEKLIEEEKRIKFKLSQLRIGNIDSTRINKKLNIRKISHLNYLHSNKMHLYLRLMTIFICIGIFYFVEFYYEFTKFISEVLFHE